MNILSIDTTADICSVALLVGDERYAFHEYRPREHAKILLPEIHRLLAKAQMLAADLDSIVFGRGPGSFTGVRIATGVAQGLAYSANCSVISVSTLQSLAFTAAQTGAQDIWVALDARMSEVYFCRYLVNSQGIPMSVCDEIVTAPDSLPVDFSERTAFIGNGWLAGYPLNSAFEGRDFTEFEKTSLPNAMDSALLAQRLLDHSLTEPLLPEKAIPTYLRDNVTWTQKPKIGS